MDLNEAREISAWNRDPKKAVWHPDTEDTMDALIAEIERLNTILYGKPMPASEAPDVAVGPLMSVPQFFGMLSELRNAALLSEATASAMLAAEADADGTGSRVEEEKGETYPVDENGVVDLRGTALGTQIDAALEAGKCPIRAAAKAALGEVPEGQPYERTFGTSTNTK